MIAVALHLTTYAPFYYASLFVLNEMWTKWFTIQSLSFLFENRFKAIVSYVMMAALFLDSTLEFTGVKFRYWFTGTKLLY